MSERIKDKLRELSRMHARRVLLSILVAIPLVIFGAWLLNYEVSQHYVHKQMAPVVNWPLITLLAFVSNLWLPWNDRKPDKKQALMRWSMISFCHSCVSYSAYRVLVDVVGWRYLFVSIGLTVVLSPTSYVLRNVWIFVAAQRVRVAVTA